MQSQNSESFEILTQNIQSVNQVLRQSAANANQ